MPGSSDPLGLERSYSKLQFSNQLNSPSVALLHALAFDILWRQQMMMNVDELHQKHVQTMIYLVDVLGTGLIDC